MAFDGMDIELIRQLANQLTRAAADIDATVRRLGTALDSTTWSGPDRDRFTGAWHSAHAGQLAQVVRGLEAAATHASTSATHQENVSSQ